MDSDELQSLLNELKGLNKWEDIPRKIEIYRILSNFIDKNQQPIKWAGIRCALAECLIAGPIKSQAEAIEEAISCYQESLNIFTREAYPQAWANIHWGLGRAFFVRVIDNIEENIEQAIDNVGLSLQFYNKNDFPEEWSNLQDILARAFFYRVRGICADNIEKSITHYRNAMENYTREKYPEKWAEIQNNLGKSYRNRIRGNPLENIESAIACYQLALEIHTRKSFPMEWANIQLNLGAAYASRIEGRQAENIVDCAISCYQNALEVYSRDISERKWAQIQSNLGDAYSRRIQGVKAVNIESAIESYQYALEVFTREKYPSDWAIVQNNMCSAYSSRIVGDRADNIERAIDYGKRALEILTHELHPSDWAMVQNNLGTAYQIRLYGKWIDNIEDSIRYLKPALEVYTAENDPPNWARIQFNLGNAYFYRFYGDRAENLEEAINCLQKSLEVRTYDTYPFQWATTENSLAISYSERLLGEKTKNLDNAREHFNKALKIFTKENFPEQWATIQNNLGNLFGYNCDSTENLENSIDCYKKALDVFTPKDYPAEHRRTQRNLGDFYFNNSYWSKAYYAYAEAMAAGEMLQAIAYSEVGRKSEIWENSKMYSRAAYSLLKLGRLDESLLLLERGKARMLSEALSLDATTINSLPKEVQNSAERTLKNIRMLEAEMRLGHDPSINVQLGNELKAARSYLSKLVNIANKEKGSLSTFGQDLQELLSLIPEGGALVLPFATSKGGAVFLLPHGIKNVVESNIVMLDDLKEQNLSSLQIGDLNNPGWLIAYVLKRGRLCELMQILDSLTFQLWEMLMGPVDERLKELNISNGASITLIPQGSINLLPLHAACHLINGDKHFFVDDYAVSYAPSLHALYMSRYRLRERKDYKVSLLAVINPTSDLGYADIEGERISEFFDADRREKLEGKKATKNEVLKEAPNCTHLHFSCHGSYHWQDAMRSGLLLAGADDSDPDLLTLSEIISKLDLKASLMVILSACETGITDFGQSIDEYIGLTAGFIQAGAPCVISTLWAVEDLSTALLMAHFYEGLLQRSLPSCRALHFAQQWLRKEVDRNYIIDFISSLLSDIEAYCSQIPIWSEEGWYLDKRRTQLEQKLRELVKEEVSDPGCKIFSHPYYWAAFIVSGG
jgi:CHAT domain-containing protein/tetratricopeptide (TPR) repeat protein